MRKKVFEEGYEITTQKWQGTDNPPTMLECLHVKESLVMYKTLPDAVEGFNPSLPWADKHFDERVSGKPLNPPPSHSIWAKGTDNYMDGGVFSHSYPERLWSKGLHKGIRYDIADLNTLIDILKKEPDTRQAYLPMFFPEDLSASLEGERVPCTLGWHFIVRKGRMDCFYPMRSCDVARHLHNDLYLANRLVLWIIEQTELDVRPGVLHFHATSLHAFKQDKLLWDKGLIR